MPALAPRQLKTILWPSLRSPLPPNHHPSPPSTTNPRITFHVSFCVPPSPGLRVVITGGGSGGHVYPAIAIADGLVTLQPTSKVLFVGTPDGIESSAVRSTGYDYRSVPAVRLKRPFISPENILLPFRLISSVLASWRLLKEFKPQIVVGTGGYVAAPVCLAALLAGIKIAIQEQNAFPGLTNRIISLFATRIFLAFNGCVKYFPKEKCAVYGNPVRLSLRRYISKIEARTHFFPKAGSIIRNEKARVILVLGGSTGAAIINIAVLNMYYEMLTEHKNRFIIWQTGTDCHYEMESLVKRHPRLLLTPFLDAMDLAYAAADIVVSRAGAMACTEILTTGKPSILIPSPQSTDGHQYNNAYIMADIAGSKVITDDELNSCSLHTAVDEVLGDENLMAEMTERSLRAARPNASEDIAKCIFAIVNIPLPE